MVHNVKNVKGFTLIELMIVVVIVAILAAVAIPSYQNSIQKTRRADAKEALTRIAAMQERYFFTNNRYGDLSELGLTGTTGTAITIPSQEGFYNIRLSNLAGAGATPAFTLQATAAGAQMNDDECNMFSLDHVGRRTAVDDNSAVTTDKCW